MCTLPFSFANRFFFVSFVGLPTGVFAIAMVARILTFEGGTLVTIPVSEALNHGEASAFVFTDGRARRELRGLHKSGSSKNKKHFAVAPFVADTWTKDEPVTVWAYCLSAECEADFDLRWTGALRDDGRWRSGFLVAIADATKTHGVRSAESAAFVELVRDPLEEVQFFRIVAIGAVAGGQLIWALVLLAQTMPVRRWFRQFRT